VDNRFKLWLAITLGLFLINFWVQAVFFPPKPKPVAQQPKDVGQKEKKPAEKESKPAKPAEAPEKPDDKTELPEAAQPETDAKPAWISLGSIDPATGYRMLVTLTNAGAAVERIELSSPKYLDLSDRSGYIGHLALENVPKLGGARVRVVGKGTPADLAGVEVDDVIVELNDLVVTSGAQFDKLLETTKPRRKATLTVLRDGKKEKLTATLAWRPLEIVRPEWKTVPLDFIADDKHDPLSLLLTLQTLDAESLTAPDDGGVGKELEGLNLWDSKWEVDGVTASEVTFRKKLDRYGLELTKKYSLAKARNADAQDDPAYHLKVEVGIQNIGSKQRTVAYQLDGPTGLPAEGAWYSQKVSRTWSSAGLRDVVLRFGANTPKEITCTEIAKNEITAYGQEPLSYIAVDAQYFAGALIPKKAQPDEMLFGDIRPIRVGEKPKEAADYKLTNTSFRLTSVPHVLEPSEAIRNEYQFFAGPKRPAILEQYPAQPPLAGQVTLDDLVYYGWFGWVSKPMLAVLHAFYYVVRNYGIAIIMLTVLVRGLMFPISRKQALGAQKMQELQPQIKALTEKYKNNPQERQRAQMELFRKHNYNPLAGCLPTFLQLPIFVGLYRSLMVDVELRDAPLISQAVRWCSNLAAPDMLIYWGNLMPEFVSKGQGFLGLGPYFNIFPIFTIILFIWQQKMFMPPAADEQTAMQQKMMQYMMVFMGLMFFKVASGLCLYFIASSLWGIAERKLLPKTIPKAGTTQPGADKKGAGEVALLANGSRSQPRKKQRK
jgi:YidC/Oxa1 family membrane protein insertase